MTTGSHIKYAKGWILALDSSKKKLFSEHLKLSQKTQTGSLMKFPAAPKIND